MGEEHGVSAGWHTSSQHAVRYTSRKSGKRTAIYMHREIMNTPKGMVTDHIDGNGLNNCRYNLRTATQRQNAQNMHIAKSSKYPGVHWHERDERWYAKIWVGKKRKHLGRFKTEIEAYNAYLTALNSLGEAIITNIEPDANQAARRKETTT